MSKVETELTKIIGISTRTSNQPGKSEVDIPKLWNRFFEEKTMENIPNKVDSNVYCVYTDYEGDYTKPFTTIIGCKVSSFDNIPDGMVSKTIGGELAEIFTASGLVNEGIVFKEWIKIWNSKELNRKYTSDYEVYDENALNMKPCDVKIYVAVDN